MYTSYLYEERLRVLCTQRKPLVLHHRDYTPRTVGDRIPEKQCRSRREQPFHLTALFTDLCKSWIMNENRNIHPLYGVGISALFPLVE